MRHALTSADSHTRARPVPCAVRSRRLDGRLRDRIALTMIELAEVLKRSDEFDVIHNCLCPIDWPEPFGLTMVEVMACATPVVATNCGAADPSQQPEGT